MRKPAIPGGQRQLNELRSSTQEPPFWHGWLRHSFTSISQLFPYREGGEKRDNVLTPPFYKHNATLTHTHTHAHKTLTNKSRCTKAAVAAEGVFANAQGSAGLFFAVVNVYLTELAC